MKGKTRNHFLIASLLGLSLLSAPVMAGSAQHFAHGIEHSAASTGHTAMGTGKTVIAAVSVPLRAVGTIGHLSGKAGDALWETSNSEVTDPLPNSDRHITIGPDPKQALKSVKH